jgi:metal-responsive CopG/Arc/MetJ family transcriptional regulator
MIRTMIQLTKEQLDALKELSKTRRTSVAKLVRESVAQYIVAAEREPSPEEKRRRAIEFVEHMEENAFPDVEGKSDLSVHHDEYYVRAGEK